MGTNSTSTLTKSNTKIISLYKINSMVRAKREAELLRFRTCCCDPRASK